MWSVTLRLLWFWALFSTFSQIQCTVIPLFCKATDYISTKRAHYHLPSFALCFLESRNIKRTKEAHDVVSYVTSFVVFGYFSHFYVVCINGNITVL